MMRFPSPWLAGLVVLGLIALGLMLDEVGADPAPDQAAARVAPAADAGAWVCAVGDTIGERTLRLVAASPPSLGGRPSEVVMAQYHDGERQRVEEIPVFPSSAATVDIPDADQQLGFTSRWWGWPSATTRLWTLPGGEMPQGLIAGPCTHPGPTHWVIPGMATAGGATARLYLANPFESDAAVSIAVTTPEGLREPRLLENVTVPKRGVKTIELNEHAPAETDIGVVVTTRSGRVIAEGVQLLDAAIGGVNGTSLARAAGAVSETWTIPWFELREGAVESWLWVTNPGQEPASLAITLHTVEGEVVPEGLGELTVAPGTVERIDLRGLTEDPSPGVTVASENGVPVAVSAATRVARGEEARTGLAVQLGVTEPSDTWITTLPTGGDRSEVLHLANPGAAPATVDVTLWAGGIVRPDELQGLTVPGGGTLAVELTPHLPELPTATAFAVAREGLIVAGTHSFASSGPLTLVAYPGVSDQAWAGGGAVPPVQQDDGMMVRLGTSLGIETVTEGEAPEDEAFPESPLSTPPVTPTEEP